MKISNKRYKQLITQWNPEQVLYIRYKTKHSCGKLTFSLAFLIEMYSKLLKLLKHVEIREIYVKNENTGVVLIHLEDLYDAYMYAIGDKYER